MTHGDTPWIGLLALGAMFGLPYLPDWLFQGPRTIKHYPRKHVCAQCGAPWTEGHTCASESPPSSEVLLGELRRISRSAALKAAKQLSRTDD